METDAPAPERTWFAVRLPATGCIPAPVGRANDGEKVHLYLDGDDAGAALVLFPHDPGGQRARLREGDFYEYSVWTPQRTIGGSGTMESINEALVRAELVEMLDGLLKTAGPRPVGGSH